MKDNINNIIQNRSSMKNNGLFANPLKFIQLISFMLINVLPFNLYSQDILEKYISIGLENNEKLIREDLAISLLEEKLEEAKGKFYPQLFFDASYTLSDGGRTIDIPAGDLLNPVYSTLNQLLGETSFPNEIPNVKEQLLPNKFHETKIRMLQPIFNSSLYYNYKAEKSQIPVALAKRGVVEDQLKKQIRIAYYQYLSSIEILEILENTDLLLMELVKLNQKLIQNGVLTRDALLSAKVQVQKNKTELASARTNLNASRTYFNHLLNRNLRDSILIDTSDIAFASELMPLESYKNEALANRKELLQLDNSLKVNTIKESLSKAQYFPSITLVGDMGYQGYGYNFDHSQEFWFLQLGLTWSIFNGFQNKKRVQQVRIEKDILDSKYKEIESEILLEVTNAFYKLQEAKENYATSLAELEYAEESFRILLKKYEHNLVLPLDITRARTDFTNAQLRAVIAQFNLKIRETELQATAH